MNWEETFLSRSRVMISGTTSPTSKVQGEGKRSLEVKTPVTLVVQLILKPAHFGLWHASGSSIKHVCCSLGNIFENVTLMMIGISLSVSLVEEDIIAIRIRYRPFSVCYTAHNLLDSQIVNVGPKHSQQTLWNKQSGKANEPVCQHSSQWRWLTHDMLVYILSNKLRWGLLNLKSMLTDGSIRLPLTKDNRNIVMFSSLWCIFIRP